MTETMTAARPWRYVWTFGGANYAPGDVREPTHAYMARTLADVGQALRDMARYGLTWDVSDATGEDMARVPVYGEPGDYADVYVLQAPGTDAGIAHAALVADMAGDPDAFYGFWRVTFGPRGGLKWERV